MGITTPSPESIPNPDVRYLTDLTDEVNLALETGYTGRNEWLEWMMYTASQSDQS